MRWLISDGSIAVNVTDTSSQWDLIWKWWFSGPVNRIWWIWLGNVHFAGASHITLLIIYLKTQSSKHLHWPTTEGRFTAAARAANYSRLQIRSCPSHVRKEVSPWFWSIDDTIDQTDRNVIQFWDGIRSRLFYEWVLGALRGKHYSRILVWSMITVWQTVFGCHHL